MNSKIIKKCLDELKKDEPKIDYVVGLLEALSDMEPVPQQRIQPVPMPSPNMPNTFPPFLTTMSVEDRAESTALAAEAEASRMAGLIEKDLSTGGNNIVLNTGR